MTGRNQHAVHISRNRVIDLDRRELRVDGVLIPLGGRAFDILRC